MSPPFMEAIFEIRWELQTIPNRPPVDSNYKIFLGRFFDRVVKDYPQHVSLPTANIADEISAYMVQHQFRVRKDKWPLIQVGQGIVTLNDTESYSWPDFKRRSEKLIKILFNTYPDQTKLKINNLVLRYLNGINYDFERENPNEFLHKLHCDISMNDEFFSITNADKKLEACDINVAYPINNPKGRLITRYGRGKRGKNDAMLWEMGIQSINGDVPKKEKEIVKWVDSAHKIPHGWYNIIKDRLG